MGQLLEVSEGQGHQYFLEFGALIEPMRSFCLLAVTETKVGCVLLRVLSGGKQHNRSGLSMC